MNRFITLTSTALLAQLAWSSPNHKNITHTIDISPASTPAPGRQVVDAAYQSFSIEFSYMADYGGNNTSVLLTLSHLQTPTNEFVQ